PSTSSACRAPPANRSAAEPTPPGKWNLPVRSTEYRMTASNRHPMTADLEHSSDDILIAGIAAGQPEALTCLFRRRQAEVYRFALHMSGSAALADDVTQDVFLIVMRESARYRAGRSVTAWLCGIARNCVRQRLERDARLERLAEDDADQVPAVRPDPVGDLARGQRIAMLRRAVLALP